MLEVPGEHYWVGLLAVCGRGVAGGGSTFVAVFFGGGRGANDGEVGGGEEGFDGGFHGCGGCKAAGWDGEMSMMLEVGRCWVPRSWNRVGGMVRAGKDFD